MEQFTIQCIYNDKENNTLVEAWTRKWMAVKGYSLSHGEIAVDIKLNVNWGCKSWRVKDESTSSTLN